MKSPGSLLFDAVRKHVGASELEPAKPGIETAEAWAALCRALELDEGEVAELVAEATGLARAAELELADAALVAMVPRRSADELAVLPLRREGQVVVVASANPLDPRLETDLEFTFSAHVTFEVATPDEIEQAISHAYNEDTPSGVSVRTLDISKTSGGGPEKEVAGAPRVAQHLLIQAIEARASDLHVQPYVTGAVARMRVDGLMRRVAHLPQDVASSVVRYFKAQADMDPTDHTIPQDGRISVSMGRQDFDLRVSTLPISGGREKIVIRLLGKKREYRLTDLGMSLEEVQHIRRLAGQPNGVILFCGPTGSGKTTTLYSILSELNTEEVSIATVENPVEYEMAGLAQTEVNELSGMTFAAALRSVLRQDPDTILIGEIRDQETAEIAMRSALTGHLVFSTLHTRNSFAAIPRLLDLGIDATVLAESLAGVVSQRLLRRLCPECSVPPEDPLTPEEELFHSITRSRPARRAVGCPACAHSGYAGRFVATEILEITPPLIDCIGEGRVGRADLMDTVSEGFHTLGSVAARRVISGDTTIEEAARVLGRALWTEIAHEYESDAPDLRALLGQIGGRAGHRTPVLLTGWPGRRGAETTKAFRNHWYEPITADTPEEAAAALREHGEVVFAILDLDPDLPDDELATVTARYREALAWSRLPAMIRYPAGRPGLPEVLRAAGATSRFIDFDVPDEVVIEKLSEALSSDADYLWGLRGSGGS